MPAPLAPRQNLRRQPLLRKAYRLRSWGSDSGWQRVSNGGRVGGVGPYDVCGRQVQRLGGGFCGLGVASTGESMNLCSL